MTDKEKKKDEMDELDEMLDDPKEETVGDFDIGDDDMKPEDIAGFVPPSEKPKEPKPPEKPKFVCKTCSKADGPLVFIEGEFYCTEHTPKPVVIPPPPPPAPVVPPPVPWHKFALQDFDSMRKRAVGGLLNQNQMFQQVGVDGTDEIQLGIGDRIVVTLIIGGKKHKAFDKTIAEGTLTIFRYVQIRYGPCTLSPHMTKGKNLTPMGYH